MTYLIVDVSAANALGRAPGRGLSQDDLDWKWLSSQGVVGAYVEGYIGNDGPNPDFTVQGQDASAAGLTTGVYDFVYPLPNVAGHANRDPVAQAQLHGAHAGPWSPGQLPTMCDLEWPTPDKWAQWGCSKQQIIDWTCAYLLTRDNLAGCTVGLYTYEDFWVEVTAGGTNVPVELAQRPLWVAGASWVKPPWTKATLWQKTGQELHVPTTSGRPPVTTDLSVFLGEDNEWSSFLGLVPEDVPTQPGT